MQFFYLFFGFLALLGLGCGSTGGLPPNPDIDINTRLYYSFSQAPDVFSSDSQTLALYHFDLAAPLKDSSSHTNHLIFSGAVGSTTGKFGEALNFTAATQFAFVTDNASLDYTQLSVDCWIKPSTIVGVKSIVSKVIGAGQYEFNLQLNAAIPRLIVSYNGTTQTTFSAIYGVVANQWNHLTAVVDGSHVIFYINGAEAGKFLYASGIKLGSSDIRIGNDGTNQFLGAIDELRIMKSALTLPFTSTLQDGTSNKINGMNFGTIGSSNPHLGNYLYLNGTTEFAQTELSAALAIPSAWTVEAWVRPESASATQLIISKGLGTAAGYYNYALEMSGGNRIRVFFQDNYGTTYQVVSVTQLVSGLWYQVAGTWDGNTLSVYINGQLEGSVLYSGAVPANNTQPVSLGRIFNGASYFGGAIDSFRISDIARTKFLP